MTVSAAPPAVRRKRGRPGLDLATVLDRGVEVFNDRGYDGTSMRDLARHLGVTKAAIYHHVPGKDALLALALDRALAGLEGAADAVVAMDGPAVDRLESLLRRSVAVLVQELPYVTLLLRVHASCRVAREALERRRRIDGLAAELIAAAIAEGDIAAGIDPVPTARVLLGVVNSIADWLRPSTPVTAAELADAVSALTLDGLRVQPA